jgi:hypothetical protein
MINVHYQKRRNSELFESLEKRENLFLSNTQNYIPIYQRFFTLNETNYNSINLNNKWYISNVFDATEDREENEQLYYCTIKNINNNKLKDKPVFFKMAPLLDPYKFLIGKYNVNDPNLFKLPDIYSNENNTNPKFLDVNNSAYVDGLFLFLTSQLIHNNKFINGVDYYGSFLAIKNDYKINIFDDIDYLNNSEFFNKNKNVLFTVDEYQYLFQEEKQKLKPIIIQHDSSMKSKMSVDSINNDVFDDVFDDSNVYNLSDLPELMDMNNTNNLNELMEIKNDKDENKVTLKSNSTCSSRSSYTSLGELDEKCNSCNEEIMEEEEEYHNTEDDSGENSEDESDNNSDDDSYEEERVNATIPKFPVQVICMEYCENTFDDLIIKNELKPEEWYSAFMQIIMILLTYQKSFAFTHNDLHTNNVMYNYTDKKYIFYCYKKKYYKVPTYGRIFKIIDFGRSIYKFNGVLFCSDSFQNGGDASSQYNTEPYFNDKKPRLEPNYSFDLCRLACSIFDYIIEDMDDIKDLSKCDDPIKRLIVEWCLDDKGINMLYKNNGVDRYPDFKLYKMIARCVHNHTPQAQLDRPEFNAFSIFKGEIPNDVIDIDEIPSYF